MCLSYMLFPSFIAFAVAKYQFLLRFRKCGSDSTEDSEAISANSVHIIVQALLPLRPFSLPWLNCPFVVQTSTKRKPPMHVIQVSQKIYIQCI